MNGRLRAAEPVIKLAPRAFALVSALIVAVGAGFSIGVFLIVTTERGASYAESYRLLSLLHHELVWRAAIIYASSLFFIALGISVISLLYSHRVAGPLYKLGVIARTVATGDLSAQAKLRRSDAIHVLADGMNDFIATYRNRIVLMDELNTTLQKTFKDPESPCWPIESGGKTDDLKKSADIMKTLLSHLRL